jgi:cobalt-precorrin-5B (C1)-methyltransferase
MIRQAVREVTPRGVRVTVSIPGGRELAVKTFNPRLGIVGGLSILGTTGRVRPFSHEALRTSLKCALSVALASGCRDLVFVPGHIGERAARRHFPALRPEQVVEVGNEWGFMLDEAAPTPMKGLLALGHPGKLAKLASGEWDTHSSRSHSAVRVVADVARRVTSEPVAEPLPATVEALFAAWDAAPQRRIADALAAEIARAVGIRLGGTRRVATVLVNLRGDWLGSDGGLTEWR